VESGNRKLSSLLLSFSCSLDSDIETFFRNRAIEFELLSKTKTYLVCDEDHLIRNGEIFILGYFSLSLKSLDIPSGLSNRKRLILDGFSSKLHGEPIRTIPCYLIGQLGKNSSIPKEQQYLTGDELLIWSLSVIKDAVNAVGGRYVVIECHNNPELIDFYKRNGFEWFDNTSFDGIPMIQMVRRLAD